MAQRGDISLSVTLLTKDGTLSAYEPLLARIEWLNQSKDAIHFDLGNGVEPDTYLEIRDHKGNRVAATPRPRPSLGGMHGGCSLAPGEVHTEIWVITGLYQFRQPGEYTIHLELLEWVEELPVLAEDSASVRVLPFDADRLEARCEEIYRSADLSLSVRVKAIYSVRDDIALPYLDSMARAWGDRYACRAMRRIGTERANRLIEALAARRDRVGEAARASLELDLKTTLWDVIAK